jgi:hypothetical protein
MVQFYSDNRTGWKSNASVQRTQSTQLIQSANDRPRIPTYFIWSGLCVVKFIQHWNGYDYFIVGENFDTFRVMQENICVEQETLRQVARPSLAGITIFLIVMRRY